MELIIRATEKLDLATRKLKYALLIRDHGPAETTYSSVAYIDRETALTMAQYDMASWLYPEEATLEHETKRIKDIELTLARHDTLYTSDDMLAGVFYYMVVFNTNTRRAYPLVLENYEKVLEAQKTWNQLGWLVLVKPERIDWKQNTGEKRIK